MSDWTAGYVADIGYTFGYYPELNPQRIKLLFLNAGLVAPAFGTACELGFGQGLSANMHGAASVTSWHGTDFNPSQAGFAQELAQAAGSDACLYDEAFDQFCSRSDLPDFDFIGLHGIWSWISDANRAVIVDFIRRKLKVGGVLYISYNTQPGWAQMLPMRHLLTEHAETLGAPGSGIVTRIDAALDFATRMLETQPRYARANNQVAERLERMKTQNRNYLAHEYFNRDWHPMHFSQMADWLAPAKLQFACSANYLEHVDAVNLTADQQQFLSDIPDPDFRQTVRDFMVNQQFRKDYWVKGRRATNVVDRSEALRTQRVMLVSPRDEVTLKADGMQGEATLTEAVYKPILDQMADHKPRTLQQLESALQPAGLAFAQILQAVLVLAGKGDVVVVQEDNVANKARKACDRLNLHLMNHARSSNEIAWLASPVTGGAVSVPRFHQLFLLARSQGHKQADAQIKFVWDLMLGLNQRLLKEGQPINDEAENIAELTRQLAEFNTKRIPILKAMGVVA